MSCLFTIAKQFEQVIDYSQGFKPAQSKQVIKQWFKAKKHFIKWHTIHKYSNDSR